MISTDSIDKTAFSVARITDPSDLREFWFSCSPYDRLRVVEFLRRINYGDYQSTQRLQRVLEVVQTSASGADKKAAGRHKDLDDLENLP